MTQKTTLSSSRLGSPNFVLSFTVAATCTFGYLLATFPPSILDPRLTTVGCGAREYPYDWLIYPIAIVLFLVTLLSMSRATSRRRAVLSSTIPLLLAYLFSFPIFRPEVPHCNILLVGTIWFCITAGWMWVHHTPTVNEEMLSESVDATARIEYIKEELTFVRMILLGLGTVYIGLLVTVLATMHSFNRSTVAKEEEAFLMDVNSYSQVSSFSIFLFTTVFRELYKKREQISSLFATIRKNAK